MEYLIIGVIVLGISALITMFVFDKYKSNKQNNAYKIKNSHLK